MKLLQPLNKFLRIFLRSGCFALCLVLSGCGASDTPAPYVHYGTQGGADSAGVHTVGFGDTLWDISRRYEMSLQDIVFVNDLSPPFALDNGQRLKLPPPRTYKVRDGDTLYGVSRTFNVTVTQIVRQNNMTAPYTIHTGDVLRLPSVAGPSSSSTKTAATSRPAGLTPKPQTKAQKRASDVINRSVPKRSDSKFGWPVDGDILSSYGPKKGGLHNDGINIRAPKGAPVRAAENGLVVYADNQLKGYGNLVLVRHEGQWMTAYAHMDKFMAKKGDVIKRGQTIGTVGSTGSVDSPQLHFEVRRGTKAINPKLYLAR